MGCAHRRAAEPRVARAAALRTALPYRQLNRLAWEARMRLALRINWSINQHAQTSAPTPLSGCSHHAAELEPSRTGAGEMRPPSTHAWPRRKACLLMFHPQDVFTMNCVQGALHCCCRTRWSEMQIARAAARWRHAAARPPPLAPLALPAYISFSPHVHLANQGAAQALRDGGRPSSRPVHSAGRGRRRAGPGAPDLHRGGDLGVQAVRSAAQQPNAGLARAPLPCAALGG